MHDDPAQAIADAAVMHRPCRGEVAAAVAEAVRDPAGDGYGAWLKAEVPSVPIADVAQDSSVTLSVSAPAP